jgi:hypothetical protein
MRFSAQKSNVKPQNHSTHPKSTTYTWRISFTPNAIIKTRDKNIAQANTRAYVIDNKEFTYNSFVMTILQEPTICKLLKSKDFTQKV